MATRISLRLVGSLVSLCLDEKPGRTGDDQGWLYDNVDNKSRAPAIATKSRALLPLLGAPYLMK